MIDLLNNYWYMVILILIVGIVSIIGKYKTIDMPSKQKELNQLFYSFLSFGIITVVLIFSLPYFYGHSFVPEKINSLDEAQRILLEQNKSLEDLRDNLDTFRLLDG